MEENPAPSGATPSALEPAAPEVPVRSKTDLQWFGMDIGGTLCKSVYFETMVSPPNGETSTGDSIDVQNLRAYLMSETYGSTGVRDSRLMLKDVTIGEMRGNVHFMKFETDRMKGAIELASKFNNISKIVLATGGGAYKFREDIKLNLGSFLCLTYDHTPWILRIASIKRYINFSFSDALAKLGV